MDWPFRRPEHNDVSNNFFYLPSNVLQDEKGKNQIDTERGTYPLVSYLSAISSKDKFRFGVIMIVVITFFYRLNLHSSIWLGLLVALLVVYYLHEEEAQKVNNEADELWVVLKSPLLNKTKYFISDPQLIKFIQDTGDLKPYNVLEYNLMVKTLDQLLRTMYDLKRGITNASETYDIFRDLKVGALNQFHSLVYRLPYIGLRDKYNYYLDSLGKILNDRQTEFIQIGRLYYNSQPVDTKTRFFDQTLDDPVANDPYNSEHYNFYN